MPRVKAMLVSADWWIEACKGQEGRRIRILAHPLPDDAKFVDAKITENGQLFLIVESKSYPELAPGTFMERQPAPTFEVVRDRVPHIVLSPN
jgi:hypothetical protein